jgi:tryptophan synthase beta chain
LRSGVPDFVVACVGGGSNAAGTFAGFLDTSAQLIGVEAEGGAAVTAGADGILHGFRTRILQDAEGQIMEAHSIAPGLDYPGVGPEHAYLASTGQARYVTVGDTDVIAALHRLARAEGIICALESAHAVAWLVNAVAAGDVPPGATVVLTLSGRGDKDMITLMELT